MGKGSTFEVKGNFSSDMTKMLPSFDRVCSSVTEKNGRLTIVTNDHVTRRFFMDYLAACRTAGFHIDDPYGDLGTAAGHNDDGYLLLVRYAEKPEVRKAKMEVTLESPESPGLQLLNLQLLNLKHEIEKDR